MAKRANPAAQQIKHSPSWEGRRLLWSSRQPLAINFASRGTSVGRFGRSWNKPQDSGKVHMWPGSQWGDTNPEKTIKKHPLPSFQKRPAMFKPCPRNFDELEAVLKVATEKSSSWYSYSWQNWWSNYRVSCPSSGRASIVHFQCLFVRAGLSTNELQCRIVASKLNWS